MTRTRSGRARRPLAAAAAALLAAWAVLGAAGTAQAAGYRYWSFWESGTGGSWAYATQGPATARPADGTVHGYRFAVSADSRDADRPRRAPDFAAVCAGTPAAEGSKRVAVVIDFGSAADAPPGEAPPAARTGCARVRPDATGAEALAAVAAPLRYNGQALLCAISGYPRQGCGEQVAGPEPSGAPESSAAGRTAAGEDAGEGAGGGGPSVGLLAGAAAVVALGTAALLRARRRGRP
ncbi:SCO2322 family protein [Streptomyces sp. DH12]|uniref:SCO2322 family protein n=1 Tax=Streptomyces sp. DH12 TaxID=2857010 RepID=UPI001E3C8A48|nr:SCO2322 family protein [Streptomyces sp. DH12]